MVVLIAKREEQEEALRQLEVSSVDFYAALRNAYYQNRTGQIEARRRGRSENYAIVRRFFAGGSGGGTLAAPGSEVGDAGSDGGEEGVESVASDE